MLFALLPVAVHTVFVTIADLVWEHTASGVASHKATCL